MFRRANRSAATEPPTEIPPFLPPDDESGLAWASDFKRRSWSLQYFARFAERINALEIGDPETGASWILTRRANVIGHDTMLEPAVVLEHPLNFERKEIGLASVRPSALNDEARFAGVCIDISILDASQFSFDAISGIALAATEAMIFDEQGGVNDTRVAHVAFALERVRWEAARLRTPKVDFDFTYFGNVDLRRTIYSDR